MRKLFVFAVILAVPVASLFADSSASQPASPDLSTPKQTFISYEKAILAADAGLAESCFAEGAPPLKEFIHTEVELSIAETGVRIAAKKQFGVKSDIGHTDTDRDNEGLISVINASDVTVEVETARLPRKLSIVHDFAAKKVGENWKIDGAAFFPLYSDESDANKERLAEFGMRTKLLVDIATGLRNGKYKNISELEKAASSANLAVLAAATQRYADSERDAIQANANAGFVPGMTDFSTPKKTFMTWKGAILADDIKKYLACYDFPDDWARQSEERVALVEIQEHLVHQAEIEKFAAAPALLNLEHDSRQSIENELNNFLQGTEVRDGNHSKVNYSANGLGHNLDYQEFVLVGNDWKIVGRSIDNADWREGVRQTLDTARKAEPLIRQLVADIKADKFKTLPEACAVQMKIYRKIRADAAATRGQ